MPAKGGTATSGRPYAALETGRDRKIIFLYIEDFRRHQRNLRPRNYRPTLGQPRYSRDDLREQMTVLRGGRDTP